LGFAFIVDDAFLPLYWSTKTCGWPFFQKQIRTHSCVVVVQILFFLHNFFKQIRPSYVGEVSEMVEDIILATMPLIPKYDVEEVLGLVYGSSTRTRGIGGRFVSGIQSMTGGKGTAYEEEIEKARREAVEELKNEARKLGANGVLAIDFETTEILEGFIIVTAYGTAVKLKK
jgi:uncharacterized protein YbjQ (UPF0145 family)